MDDVDRKFEKFFSKDPFVERGFIKRTDDQPSPLDLPEDIAEKTSDMVDKFVEPIRKFGDDTGRYVDREAEKVGNINKSAMKIYFPLQVVSSPITLALLIKNSKMHPEWSNDRIIEETNKESFEWVLDAANIFWPGTAVDGKEVVKERIGGLVKDMTKEDMFS
jgi:hypothetical protein